MKGFLKYLPKTKELLDKAKNKPTIEDRIEALELAMLEQITGGLEDV